MCVGAEASRSGARGVDGRRAGGPRSAPEGSPRAGVRPRPGAARPRARASGAFGAVGPGGRARSAARSAVSHESALSGVVARVFARARQATENLGEFLSGDRIENSPYQLFMEQDQFCKILCQVTLKAHEVAALKAIVKEEYHHNWIIDNLPAASIVDSEQYITTAYAGGFPVGFYEKHKAYLFNHVNIIVEYHPLDDGSRVVGFYVEPFTVKHKFANGQKWDGDDVAAAPPLETCDKSGPMVFENIQTKQEIVAGNVLYTYDVLWRASNVRWASRWDIYLSMDNAVPDKVHWFSIVNSMLIVLFLSVMVAMILIRNLTRDISR